LQGAYEGSPNKVKPAAPAFTLGTRASPEKPKDTPGPDAYDVRDAVAKIKGTNLAATLKPRLDDAVINDSPGPVRLCLCVFLRVRRLSPSVFAGRIPDDGGDQQDQGGAAGLHDAAEERD
jgi:hypothetical protein